MDKISVFLADWQVLFREGIHFTLSGEDDMDVVGEDTNNEETFNFVEANQPKVAILNINHGKFTGIEVTRRIKASFPSVSVILIMDAEDEELLYAALKCGASACISKDIDPDQLVDIVRKVSQGIKPISEVLFRPGFASRIIEEFEASSLLNKEVGNLLAHLTSRESDILRLISNGSSIEKLAHDLNANADAIRSSLDQIVAKLVSNEHNREVIEAAQGRSSSIFRAKPGTEYITKDEFNAFKESLRDRLKSLFGELD